MSPCALFSCSYHTVYLYIQGFLGSGPATPFWITFCKPLCKKISLTTCNTTKFRFCLWFTLWKLENKTLWFQFYQHDDLQTSQCVSFYFWRVSFSYLFGLIFLRTICFTFVYTMFQAHFCSFISWKSCELVVNTLI